MRIVIAVLAVVVVAAVAWLLVEARALHSPATAPRGVAATPPQVPPSLPPPPREPAVAAPSRPEAHPRTLPPSSGPVVPPAEPAQPPPPSAPPTPSELATARAHVQAVLTAVTHLCPLPRDADRSGHLVVRVTTSRDRVQTVEHRDGALPAPVAACIDKRLQAARWPAAPVPMTFDLDVRASDLQ